MDVPRTEIRRWQDHTAVNAYAYAKNKSRFNYFQVICEMTWQRSEVVGNRPWCLAGEVGSSVPWCPATHRGGPPLVRGFGAGQQLRP